MNTRNCQEVIASMIEKIPADKEDFLRDLRWNFKDAGYKAPEETLQWQRTQQTLMAHIPKPSDDWEFEVLSIFTTKSTDDLRKVFKSKQF